MIITRAFFQEQDNNDLVFTIEFADSEELSIPIPGSQRRKFADIYEFSGKVQNTIDLFAQNIDKFNWYRIYGGEPIQVVGVQMADGALDKIYVSNIHYRYNEGPEFVLSLTNFLKQFQIGE